MKIRLTANSLVSLPKDLESIKLEHGYSFGISHDSTKIEKKWLTKVISSMEKGVAYVVQNSEESKHIVQYIAKAAHFLNEQKETNEEHIKGLNIQVNVDSAFNNFLKVSSRVLGEIFQNVMPKIVDSIHQKIDPLINTNLGFINIPSKSIYLGTNIFNEKENNFTFNLREKLGLEIATNLVVFHEVSHTFEKTNKDEYTHNSINEVILNIKYASSVVLNKDNTEKINKQLKEISEWKDKQLDLFYLINLNILTGEIYADVSAALLQRNKDILEGFHTKERDINIVDVMMEGRSVDQNKSMKYCSANIYVNDVHHFTTPGLEYLKVLYENNTIENKILTQEEIYKISSKAMEQGVAKVVLTSINANEENLEQLKILFSMEKNVEGKTFDINNKKTENYKKRIEELIGLVEKKWLKNFEEKKDFIKEENIFIKRAIWNSMFHKEAFKTDMEICKVSDKSNNNSLSEESALIKESTPKIKVNSFTTIIESIRKFKENTTAELKNIEPSKAVFKPK